MHPYCFLRMQARMIFRPESALPRTYLCIGKYMYTGHHSYALSGAYSSVMTTVYRRYPGAHLSCRGRKTSAVPAINAHLAVFNCPTTILLSVFTQNGCACQDCIHIARAGARVARYRDEAQKKYTHRARGRETITICMSIDNTV